MHKGHITLSLIFVLLTGIAFNADAQQRKSSKTKKTAVEKKPVKPVNELFKSMLSSTAKVMFIDSVIVDKTDFLKSIPLCDKMGSITNENSANEFTNGYKNHKIIAKGDSVNGRYLYSSDKIGEKWTEPVRLTFEEELSNYDYPFVMSDGVTLFFSAKGENSIGGYDIFTTNYDIQNGTYYKPVNYGLPFNSEANDYLLVIDDMNTFGWLVSDRYQPEDKVCIYTFVPQTTRLNFESDDISTEELIKYAELRSISDTWQFGDHDGEIKRLKQTISQWSHDKYPQNNATLVINDNRICSKVDDLKTATGKKLFNQWTALKNEIARQEKELSDTYDACALKKTDNVQISKIESREKSLDDNRRRLSTLEKQIRKEENK